MSSAGPARPRLPLLGALRSRMLGPDFPLLIHHRAGDTDICAGPSLWMMGRQRATAPVPDRPPAALPAPRGGAAWVAALLGALRRRTPLVHVDRWDGPLPTGPGVWAGDGTWLDAATLWRQGRETADTLGLVHGSRAHVAGDWTGRSTEVLALVGALLVGAELHTTPPGQPAGPLLAAGGSLPTHRLGPATARDQSWPPALRWPA